ncbi:MAG: arginase [Xylanivirga thermophila]|jgi:hypothetical protein|uniref:arginase n=1 Tax=Xylanivirga thermophila TaxID=2496273 RepID=UPI0039F51F7E
MDTLLSIDWDYFIKTDDSWIYSLIENNKNIVMMWYKRYFEAKRCGKNLEENFKLDKGLINSFYDLLNNIFHIKDNAKMYISDSHKLSYYITQRFKCTDVYSFDAHTDLGYGGLAALDFGVNCANWLGKLLKDRLIKKAHIILSPLSHESKDQFSEINSEFNVQYDSMDKLFNMPEISLIHIARSGTWTPPWLDDEFFKFINSFNRPYKICNYTHRKWTPNDLTLADIIYNLVS